MNRLSLQTSFSTPSVNREDSLLGLQGFAGLKRISCPNRVYRTRTLQAQAGAISTVQSFLLTSCLGKQLQESPRGNIDIDTGTHMRLGDNTPSL